jgi:hypothetical protein
LLAGRLGPWKFSREEREWFTGEKPYPQKAAAA